MGATDNILYGGPEAALIDSDCRSLGEAVLKTFSAFGDADVFVRI